MLHISDCASSRLWSFVRGISRSTVGVSSGAASPYFQGASQLSEPASILSAIVSASPRASLLGATAVESALVIETLSTFPPTGAPPAALASLEARLTSSSYVAGPRLTIADVVALFSSAPALAALDTDARAKAHAQTLRWLDQVYHEEESLLLDAAAVGVPRVPTPERAPLGAALASAAVAPAAPVADKKAKVPKAAGGAGGGGAATAAAPPAERSALSELDFGVGVITEAWPHPDSDKLWCEKISFGDAEPVREIASGLRAVFTHAQMVGQRVVVVRNLKSRKLAGFASNGMVLCATSGDSVEFVVPPAGAALGERVVFAQHDGPPAEPSRVDKKKLFEAVAPGLRVDAEGRATWEGVVFGTSAGPCTVATLREGGIK